MNREKVKEARKAYFEAVLTKKDGSKRDLTIVKKVLSIGAKIAVGLVLVALGFLFGDKGIEMFDRWTGKSNCSEADSESTVAFETPTSEITE